jgi:hypothetical protein
MRHGGWLQTDIAASLLLLLLARLLQCLIISPSRFPSAGIVGTVLTGGESSLPDFKDVISGAFKVSSHPPYLSALLLRLY